MAEVVPDQTNSPGRTHQTDVARAALLEAARRVATRDGVDQVKISTVADEANFARSTAYGYFRSRDELLQSVVADDLDKLAQILRQARGLPEPGAPATPSHIERYVLPETKREIVADSGEDFEEGPAGNVEEPSDLSSPQAATEDDMPKDQPSAKLEVPESQRAPTLDERIRLLARRIAATPELGGTDMDESQEQKFSTLEVRTPIEVAPEVPPQAQNDSEAAETSVQHSNESETSDTAVALSEQALSPQAAPATVAIEVAASEASSHESPSGGQSANAADTAATSVPANDVAQEAETPPPPVAEEIAPEEAKKPESYLAAARRAAMSSVAAAPGIEQAGPGRGVSRTGLMIAGAAACVVVLVGAVVLLRSVGHSPAPVFQAPRVAANGITHKSHPRVVAAKPLTPLDQVTEEARAGKPDAELAVGLKYLAGDGIPKDEAEGTKWISRAAAAGNAPAEDWLGSLYQHGRGVTADQALAFSWYEKSAQQGNRKAMHDLANAYAQGSGTAVNYFEAARWFSRAADLGYVDSAFNLAVLYERGDGVPQSLLDAYKWYAIASAAGDQESKTRMTAIASELSPDDLAAAQKAAAAFRPQPMATGANILARGLVIAAH